MARELLNLIVDLRDSDRYGPGSSRRFLEAVQRGGFAVEHYAEGEAPDRFLAWLDDEFGGTWSSEAVLGKNFVATHGDAYAGFATYEPQGLRFRWLDAYRHRPDVGIFGPFGVARAFRRGILGRALLRAALGALAENGFAFALVPAVGASRLAAYYEREVSAAVVERFDVGAWMQPVRTTVLASGNGTNFQAVLDAAARGELSLDVGAIVSNNPEAFALVRAERAGVPTRVAFAWDRTVEKRETFDERVLHAVRQTDPQLVLLLGWMHVLPERFLAAFPEVINIHPAFLPVDQRRDAVVLPDGSIMPAFRGAHAVRDALAAGCRWTGATAHRVVVDADRGPVLMRKPVAIDGATTETAVMERLRPIEHAVLLGAILRWIYETPLSVS